MMHLALKTLPARLVTRQSNTNWEAPALLSWRERGIPADFVQTPAVFKYLTNGQVSAVMAAQSKLTPQLQKVQKYPVYYPVQ